MSAFVVGREHIDALVRLGLDGPSEWHGGPGNSWHPYRFYVVGPQASPDEWPTVTGYTLTREGSEDDPTVFSADELGRELWRENVASIHGRYPDTIDGGQYPGPIDFGPAQVEAYAYPAGPFGPQALTAGDGINAARCFDYQACEHPGWRLSIAHAYIESLVDSLVRTLPQVSGSDTWEVTA